MKRKYCQRCTDSHSDESHFCASVTSSRMDVLQAFVGSVLREHPLKKRAVSKPTLRQEIDAQAQEDLNMVPLIGQHIPRLTDPSNNPLGETFEPSQLLPTTPCPMSQLNSPLHNNPSSPALPSINLPVSQSHNLLGYRDSGSATSSPEMEANIVMDVDESPHSYAAQAEYAISQFSLLSEYESKCYDSEDEFSAGDTLDSGFQRSPYGKSYVREGHVVHSNAKRPAWEDICKPKLTSKRKRSNDSTYARFAILTTMGEGASSSQSAKGKRDH